MASRFGNRAAGTDGGDFTHRERVAAHYQVSVVVKNRLRMVLFAHMLLWILMLVRVSDGVLRAVGISSDALAGMGLPEPSPYEYIWLPSILGVVFCLTALPRNRHSHIRIAYFAIFCFGVLPVLWGAGVGLSSFWAWVTDSDVEQPIKERFTYWNGFPIVVLNFIFYVIAFQVHILSMYLCDQLRSAWGPPVGGGAARTNRGSTKVD